MTPFTLPDFVAESNRIEGIEVVTPREVEAWTRLLDLPAIFTDDLQRFVAEIQPGAVLRDRAGRDVRVGDHFPPPGDPRIRVQLDLLLEGARELRRREESAFHVHRAYETLHPFMDGNGRSGRALWLWQLGGVRRAPLGFLHHWYYHSLRYGR